MKVTVVVCTHSESMYEHFIECIESLQTQTYEAIEIVIVVDGKKSICTRTREDFGTCERILIHCNETNRGVSYSRTKGAELASGEVVAFIDDDAVADPRWVKELVKTYEETDALAVGGRMEGRWLAGNPWYLPEEFYWLVGVTHEGFAESGTEVRNTFESNLSFRREVFLELGGFNPRLGPTAETYSHSEGAEIGTRLQTQFDRGVVYNAEAIVRHKVFEHRTKFGWLCQRAFEQGVSKQRMQQEVQAKRGEERDFLKALLFVHTPRRVRQLVESPSMDKLGQLLMLFVFTGLVGAGFMYSTIRHLCTR